jgi:hypothetical protein
LKIRRHRSPYLSSLAQKTGSRAVLSPGTLAALGRYDWPGNVRELHNVLASLIVSSPPRGSVSAFHLPSHVGRSVALVEARSLAAARREFELRFVRAALARVDGRTARAARELGVRAGPAKLLARPGLRDGAGKGPSPARRMRRISRFPGLFLPAIVLAFTILGDTQEAMGPGRRDV